MPRPRLSKALRGKRRWIGFHAPGEMAGRAEIEAELARRAPAEDWRLYDCVKPIEGQDHHRAILRVRLEDATAWRAAFEASPFESVTTSGKIRLVRERMELPRPQRRRRR